jgi:hypothetical protein
LDFDLSALLVDFVIRAMRVVCRDTAFHSWHAFAITRALENQAYFFSLSFAGERWGSSISVPPWIDESRGPKWSPQILGQDEAVLVLRLDLSEVLCVHAFFVVLCHSPNVIAWYVYAFCEILSIGERAGAGWNINRRGSQAGI